MMDDQEEDVDMLFGNEPATFIRDTPPSDGPQLGHQDEPNDVIPKIEAVFETVADALLNERADVVISLAADPNSGSNERIVRSRRVVFTFPGKTELEAWRFSVVMRLLELIHESVSDNVVLTKRDLYYRDPALFGKQSTVDRYVDLIAAAFVVPRSSLHVTAGVKGLMAGAGVIHRRDGSSISLGNVQNGMLVPSVDEVLSVDLSRVRWVLVIEKEAAFQGIISSEAWEEMKWHAILITGKGYPDMATRMITRFISSASPQNGFAEPPVYGLMDYDPDGMAILHTYKHGSEKSQEKDTEMTVPAIQWMGLHSRDITDKGKTHRNQGLMSLTRRDRHKARKMLEWRQFAGTEEAVHWRRELQVMLVLNLKAEIQIIDSDSSGLASMIKDAVSHT